MKIGEKAAEVVLTALAGGTIAFLASVGFSSPKANADAHAAQDAAKFADHDNKFAVQEEKNKDFDQRLGEFAVGQGRMDQKLDDLIDGLGIARHHSRPPK